MSTPSPAILEPPQVRELSPAPDPFAALRRLAVRDRPILFDSARRLPELGRYSYLACDPFAWFEVQDVEYGSDPFADVRRAWGTWRAEAVPDLPPFQGGAAGLLGYELGRAWERVPRAAHDELGFPVLALGLYDSVVAWDHQEDRCWLIARGFPETDPEARRSRAQERLDALAAWLSHPAVPSGDPLGFNPYRGHCPDVRLAPRHPVGGRPGLTSDFSEAVYLAAVRRVVEYIHAGDVFQANLSQRLLHALRVRPLELYARLRACNPAPFSAYFAKDDWAIASASPERFLAVRGDEVETRPIKGTRRRGAGPEADLFVRDELRSSDKDLAENVMIVDLLRNDLSRVCVPGTIRVPRLCGVETYETVQHLVSEIRGRLRPDRDAWDLLAATFPGGSITGAPKVRAMEIVAEQEPTARGPYCGSLCWVGFDGMLDSSILIRTFACRGGHVQCGAGGGIVADSDPRDEYAETWSKAEGMLRAL